MSKPRRTSKAVEPLSPRERGRGEGSATAQTPRATEPSSGAARHLLPEGEGKTPSSSFPRKRESSDVSSSGNWESRDFTAALSEEKPPRHGKLQARNYKVTGKFPVVDQGQSEIAGWTNDDNLVIDSGFPYIVFGDHTRVFKYVDKPFALGADGTQLLKPSREYCSRFFYYACLQLDLPSRGYNRHFTFLKETSLPLPPKPEQQKIAAVLWKLQRAIATQDKLLKATDDLKASAMQRLFTHGLRGEPLKDTEIGPMPESWNHATLGELCNPNDGAIQTGPFGSQLHAREYQAEGTPIVNPTHLLGNQINRDDVPRISDERAQDLSRHALEAGDILFARRGQIGRHGLIGDKEAGWICGTGCFLVRVRHPDIDNAYLSRYFALPGVVEWLEANAAGAIMPNLNNAVLSRLPVHFPVLSEQRAIASTLATIDRKLAHHRAKRAALDGLFQTLLHQLMTGALRVDALDIDVSEVVEPASPPQGAAA
jgi:type I restriction enzyme S subunit